MLLYVQPQHQHVDPSTPACLDKYAVGTHILDLGTDVFASSLCSFAEYRSVWQLGVSYLAWQSAIV